MLINYAIDINAILILLFYVIIILYTHIYYLQFRVLSN